MKNIDEVASFYQEEDFDFVLLKYGFKTFLENKFGNNYLELGCSIGISTYLLLDDAEKIDIIEGSLENIKKTKKRISDNKKAHFHHSYWGKHSYPEKEYSDIIWSRGLEHIENPEKVLEKIKPSLQANGRLHIIVPNAQSMHRQAGVKMGMLAGPYHLSERDIALGHFKIYDFGSLTAVLKKCNYKITSQSGIIVKPLPNNKMFELYKENPELIKGFYELGKEMPELCAEIYVCVVPK